MREEHRSDEQTTIVIKSHAVTASGLRLLYEVDSSLGHLVPHLRLIVDEDVDMDTVVSVSHVTKTRVLTRGVKPYVSAIASLENSPTDS